MNHRDREEVEFLIECAVWALAVEIRKACHPQKRDVASIHLTTQGAQVQLTDAQEVTYSIVESDPAGQALATPEGTAVWASDDAGAFVTLTPSADGFSCVVAAVSGANGTATISATVTVVEPSDGSTQTFTGSDGVAVAVPLADVGSIALKSGDIAQKPV